MPAFKVNGIERDESRMRVALVGEILDGDVYPGMQVVIPLSHSVAMTFEIDGVEHLDGFSQKCARLTSNESDEDVYDFLVGFNFVGETLEVSRKNIRHVDQSQ
jgi:hypothetical protein